MHKLGYFANRYHIQQFRAGITNIRNDKYYLLVDLSEDNYQILVCFEEINIYDAVIT